VGVDGLKVQDAAMVTGVFIAIPEKSPVLPSSVWGLIQATTPGRRCQIVCIKAYCTGEIDVSADCGSLSLLETKTGN
jgi:hypothetical protein